MKTDRSTNRLAVVMLAAAAAAAVSSAQTAPPKTTKTPPNLSGVYTLSGKPDKSAGKTFSSDGKDVSAIYVKSSGDLTLTDATVTTSADTTSEDNSGAFGQNAAVLAVRGKIKMTGGSITTSGTGANAIFSSGSGAVVTLAKVNLSTTGAGAPGVMAVSGGSA